MSNKCVKIDAMQKQITGQAGFQNVSDHSLWRAKNAIVNHTNRDYLVCMWHGLALYTHETTLRCFLCGVLVPKASIHTCHTR
jgi:hypothetical protein